LKPPVQKFFTACFNVAIAAAKPDTALAKILPAPPKGRLLVIGAGKGVAQLAQSFERQYVGELSGLVVTRYGHAVPCQRIAVMEAAHPIPDQNSLNAGQRLLDLVKGLNSDDIVAALICGGGSALLAAPLAPMTLADEIAVNQALLASGAPIGDMNILRRHLSAIKGGRLAEAAQPARLVNYIISDVPGDDPAEVASGPTVTANTTPNDAQRIIDTYQLDLPDTVASVLASDASRCPKVSADTHLIASARVSLAAVAAFVRQKGWRVLDLGDAVEGEAREVAKAHAQIALACQQHGEKTVIISGGETTVNLTGTGRGGRNTEYLLALAIAIDGYDKISAFAADTDGIDGSEDNAGAFIDGKTLSQLRKKGLSAPQMLANNDAYSAFEAIDALFSPGPTGTNVNDLRVICIGGSAE